MNYYDKMDEIDEGLNQEITSLGLKQRYGRLRNKIKRYSSSKRESGEELYDEDDYLDESVISNIKAKILKLSNRSIIGKDRIEKVAAKLSKSVDHLSTKIDESALYELSFFKKKTPPKPTAPYTKEDLEEVIEYVYESELLAYTYIDKTAELGFSAVKKILATDEKSNEAERAKILNQTFKKLEDYSDEFSTKRKSKIKGYKDGRMAELFNKILPYINYGCAGMKEQKDLEEMQKIASNNIDKVNSLYEKFISLRTNLVNRANVISTDIERCGTTSDKFAYSAEIYVKIISDFSIKQAEGCARDLLFLSDTLIEIKRI